MRSMYWDNAKVLLIVLVVAGHIIEVDKGLIGEPVHWLIYTFHMPAFIFIAGYWSRKEPWKETLRKCLTRFLLPLFLFQALYDYINYFWFGTPILTDYQYLNFSLWFLASMVFWKCTLQLIIRWKWLLIPFLVLFLTHRFWIPDVREWSTGRAIYFSLFFYLGYYVKTKQETWSKWLQHLSNIRSLFPFIGAAGMVAVYLLHTNGVIHISFAWLRGYMLAEEWSPAFSITYLMMYQVYVFLFSCIMVGFFFLCVPKGTYSWSKWGASTMAVYLLHSFIRHWLLKEGFHYPVDTWAGVWAVLSISVVIVYVLSQPFFTRFINVVTGLKENDEPKTSNVTKPC